MSDLNKDLESLVGDMGMSVSNEAPTNLESTAEQPQEAPVDSAPQEVQEPVQQEAQQFQEPTQPQQTEAAVEQPQSSLQEDDEDISDEEMEAAMLGYLSERLGRQVSSFDEIGQSENTSTEIDERVAAINQFVRETGRDPQDWFTYQAMNPSEMDDLAAVRTQLRNQYGDISNDDLDLLLNNKYKLDADLHDEADVRLSQLQLKMDADKARQEIESVRSQYAAPQRAEQEYEGIVDDQWLGDMSAEVDALDGIEFELGKKRQIVYIRS